VWVTVGRRIAVACVVLVVATAFQWTHATADSGMRARPVKGAACRTPSTFTANHENEVRGSTRRGSLFGLMFGERVPPRAGDEVKIVWRMTGHGSLKVRLTAPDGKRNPLTFGPVAHSSSSYQRPGDEWGTGFRFAKAGCWHIRLARSNNVGDVWLDVQPATA
jgi:hypothetical protein